jgi:hypothetical protein
MAAHIMVKSYCSLLCLKNKTHHLKTGKGAGNGKARFKNCKQMSEYQQLLLLRDMWDLIHNTTFSS